LYRSGFFAALLFLLLAPAVLFSAAADSDRIGASFERVGPFGGDVRALLIDARDSKVLFLGSSDGQIFKSIDGGESWAPLVPGIGRRGLVVDTLVQHPSDLNRFYAGAWDRLSSGGGLFESSDGGRTWREVRLPRPKNAVRGFAVSPADNRKMIVGTLEGVLVSENGGLRWTQVLSSGGVVPSIESVAIDPVNPRNLYAGTWHLGYRSQDFGKTWAQTPRGMVGDSDIFSLAVNPRNPEIVYASACSGVYRSGNRAESWSRLKLRQGSSSIRAQIVSIDPAEPNRVYVGSTEGLFVSNDDGRTWLRKTDSRITVNAIQIDPRDSRRIFLGTENQGVLVSEDAGRSWKTSHDGFSQLYIASIMPDPSSTGLFLVGVRSAGGDGGVYSFSNHRSQWKQLSPEIASQGDVLSIFPIRGGESLLAGTTRGIYHRAAGSSGWTKLAGPTAALKINDLAAGPGGEWIYAATDEGVYRASAGELKFEKPDKRPYGPMVNCLAVLDGVPAVVYAGGSMGVLRSVDNGMTWVASAAGLPMRASVQCLAASPGDSRHLFAGTVGGLFESKDVGSSWQKAADGRLAVDVAAVAFLDRAGQKVMAADHANGGVYLSQDAGATWIRIVSPGFDAPVGALAQDPARPSWVYLGTSSEGVYRLKLPEALFPALSR
jgi:photosystem II stability/assembly factor-like uncharacterized protein